MRSNGDVKEEIFNTMRIRLKGIHGNNIATSKVRVRVALPNNCPRLASATERDKGD